MSDTQNAETGHHGLGRTLLFIACFIFLVICGLVTPLRSETSNHGSLKRHFERLEKHRSRIDILASIQDPALLKEATRRIHLTENSFQNQLYSIDEFHYDPAKHQFIVSSHSAQLHNHTNVRVGKRLYQGALIRLLTETARSLKSDAVAADILLEVRSLSSEALAFWEPEVRELLKTLAPAKREALAGSWQKFLKKHPHFDKQGP